MSDTDESQPLQAQVDQLRERLDFIAPRLSLLTGALDYFQKVESEASVQLSRLKFADGVCQAGAGGIGESQPLNMAIWFQAVTDSILAQVETKVTTQTQLQEQAQTLKHVQQTQTQLQMQSEALREMDEHAQAHTKEQTQALKTLETQVKQLETKVHHGASLQKDRSPSGSSSPRVASLHRDPSPSGSSSPHFGGDAVIRREWRSSGGTDQHLQVASVFPDRDMMPGKSSLHTPFPVEQHQSSPHLVKPQALVPSHMDAVGMETTLERHGLALGQGTWANAYRQASGTRRSALRMLCVCGIITERELADDLTIISEEHIEECIAIAHHMLKRWPPAHGPPPVQESKRFFEDQLAALYMSKGPAVFIPDEHR